MYGMNRVSGAEPFSDYVKGVPVMLIFYYLVVFDIVAHEELFSKFGCGSCSAREIDDVAYESDREEKYIGKQS